MSSSPNLAEILSKIHDGICVLGSDEQVTFVNEKATHILQTADDDFRGKITKAARDRAATRFEHFHASMNQWFEHQAYPNVDGGLTLISRDTTSRHRIEDALRASEERFRRVVESRIIGVVVIQDGFITEANDVFLNMLGYTRTDVVTHQLNWRQMTPSDCDDLDAEARSELHASGMFSPYEKEFLCNDGRRVPVLVCGVATQVKSDAEETLCLVLDLSERRRADERLRSILEGGKILASSLECEKMLPELAEFIVSKLADSCVIFIKEDDRLVRVTSAHSIPIKPDEELETRVSRVMESGRGEMMVAPISRAIVPIVAVDEVAGAIAISSARPDAFDSEDFHVFDALGRRAGVALENARLYRETQRANRLKDEFVAIISHELRTPLTPILGGVYMIRSEPNDEKVFGRALDLIERNAKTQVKIVDDLLDVSRALSGKLRLNMETVDLGAVVQGAIDTVRPASEAKNIGIILRLGPVNGTVIGDADRLQQVIWNLLANSVKFTPDSGQITVEMGEHGGNAEIRVADSGIGIDPGFLPHVFDRFRQADGSRTRLHGGLGLGLAIVRHLVEAHGGTVHALSSGDEKGSTFVVRLPLRQLVRSAQERG
jgi:PAS domain S-box-containing protein